MVTQYYQVLVPSFQQNDADIYVLNVPVWYRKKGVNSGILEIGT